MAAWTLVLEVIWRRISPLNHNLVRRSARCTYLFSTREGLDDTLISLISIELKAFKGNLPIFQTSNKKLSSNISQWKLSCFKYKRISIFKFNLSFVHQQFVSMYMFFIFFYLYSWDVCLNVRRLSKYWI